MERKFPEANEENKLTSEANKQILQANIDSVFFFSVSNFCIVGRYETTKIN